MEGSQRTNWRAAYEDEEVDNTGRVSPLVVVLWGRASSVGSEEMGRHCGRTQLMSLTKLGRTRRQ